MNPEQTLEQAAQAFLNSERPDSIPDGQVYKGTENTVAIDTDETAGQPQVKTLPCVTLEAEGDHQQVGRATRCFRGNLLIHVEADAHNTTDADFDSMCAEVFDLFNISELADRLASSLDNFDCLYANMTDSGRAIKNGSIWQNTFRVDCVYAQANL